MNSAIVRKLLGSVLVVSLLASCSRGDQAGGPPGMAGGAPALPVKVLDLQANSVDEKSEFVGTLEAAEKVTLQSQIQGRVERVFVANGDRVNPGTPIVSLSVDQTQANVAAAQAGVSSAQASVNSARGAFSSAQAQLQAAEATRAKAAAELQLQQSEYSRTESLVTQGAQSQQQLDIARRNLDTAQADVAAADKQVNAARAAVTQANAAVAEAQASVKEAQSRVTAASVDLGFKQVTSPINGLVGDFTVKVGDYLTPQTNITTITSNQQLDMRISVPSNYSDRLRTGLSVQLLDPNTKKALGSGSIYFISPQIDAGAQSILTKARFPNNGSLRDGQYVQATITWNRTSGIVVPTTAISRIGGQAFVFVVEEQKTESGEVQSIVSQRPVQLGSIQNNHYVVLEGLKAGDRIATTNILKLSDGAPVQPETET